MSGTRALVSRLGPIHLEPYDAIGMCLSASWPLKRTRTSVEDAACEGSDVVVWGCAAYAIGCLNWSTKVSAESSFDCVVEVSTWC